MKDSKTIRNEHQSFVDAWKKIQEDNSSTPVAEGSNSLDKMTKTPKKGYKVENLSHGGHQQGPESGKVFIGFCSKDKKQSLH